MDLFQIERLAMFFFFLRMGWQCINWMEVETLIHNRNNASGKIEKDIMGLFGYNLFYWKLKTL